MTRHEQSTDNATAEAPERAELDEVQLEGVTGGAGFLNGSLTSQEAPTPWVNNGGANPDGFIMKDSVIVRTGR